MAATYEELMSAARNGYGSSGYFEYDPEKDPIFQSYRRTYTREGERAAANALAQASAATGGIPSSYANTAAQEAGNYYAAKLADIIPELRSQALSEEQQAFENALRIYGLTGRATGPLSAYLSAQSSAGGGAAAPVYYYGGGGGSSKKTTTGGSGANVTVPITNTIKKPGAGSGISSSVDSVSGAAPRSDSPTALDYLDYLESQGYSPRSQGYTVSYGTGGPKKNAVK